MSGITYQSFQRDFRIEKRLGKGNYAVVNQVLHLLDHHSYAHKCIEFASFDELSIAFNEVETIKCIDDERIVKVTRPPMQLVYYYTRENKRTGKFELGIIMELCSSTLSETMRLRKRKNDYFSKAELREFVSTMIPFFAKMQRKGYMHRDIKPDNILLVKNAYNKLEYKVGDFGFAIKLNAYSTQNVAGTMEYVSPKLMVKFKDNKVIVPGHNFKDDVYSFGKTLYEYMLLECNEKTLMEKKALDCNPRYSSDYWGLVSLMMRTEEHERPDFLYLESFGIKKGLINAPEGQLSKHNFLSISTVNGVQIKREFSIDRPGLDKKARKGLSKGKDDITKTKKKETEIDTDATSTIEVTDHKPPVKVKQQKSKKVINYGEVIHSLLAQDNFLFVGSQGKLGIMILATERLFKLKFDAATPITCMKIDNVRKYLVFGTMSGKLFTIEINDVKKFIVDNAKLLEKKGDLDLELKQLRHCEIECSLPISVFDCCYGEDKKEPTYILGHFTGEITVIKENVKTSKLSFSRQPITHLLCKGGYLYTSSGDGFFRRESAPTLDLWNKQNQKVCKPYREMKSCVYKHNQLLVTFQLIEECAYNRTVTKPENKYLAILISYDGLAHIISRSFRLERLIRLSHHNIITAFFQEKATSELGIQGLIVDTQGELFSETGKSLMRTEQRSVSSLSMQGPNLYLGCYTKQLVLVGQEQVVMV